jgi:hypothetical protein
MTDLYFYDLPNAVKIRADKIKAEEIFVRDPSSGVYVKLTPGGGGGGGSLPYYLKGNSVEIDDFTEGVGSALTSTSLILGDNAGNATLDKATIDTASRLKTMETSGVNTDFTALNGSHIVVYNPDTKVYRPAGAYLTVSHPTLATWRNQLAYNGFTLTDQSTVGRFISLGSNGGYINNSNVLRSRFDIDRGVIWDRTTFKATIADKDIFHCGYVYSSELKDLTKDYSQLRINELVFKDISGEWALGREGVSAANKMIQALQGTAWPAEDEQLPLVFDPNSGFAKHVSTLRLGTGPSTYTSMATGGVTSVSSGNVGALTHTTLGMSTDLTNSLVDAGAISNTNSSKQLTLIANGTLTLGASTLVKGRILDTAVSRSILSNLALVFTNSGGASVTFNRDDVTVTNRLKALADAVPGANSKLVMYNTSSRMFNTIDIPSASGSVPAWVGTDAAYFTYSPGVGVYQTLLNLEPKIFYTSGGTEWASQIKDSGFSSTRTSLSGSYRKINYHYDGITLSEADAGGANVKTWNVDRAALMAIKKKVKWTAPSYASWPATNPADIVSGTVTGYTNTLYRHELDAIDSTLWVDLSPWALSLPVGGANSRGICFQFKIHDSTENPDFQVSYSDSSGVVVSGQNVWVRRTSGSTSYRALFVTFTASGSTRTIDGKLKIKLVESAEPYYPEITTTTPTAITI